MELTIPPGSWGGMGHYFTAKTQLVLVGALVTRWDDHVSFRFLITQGYLRLREYNEVDINLNPALRFFIQIRHS